MTEGERGWVLSQVRAGERSATVTQTLRVKLLLSLAIAGEWLETAALADDTWVMRRCVQLALFCAEALDTVPGPWDLPEPSASQVRTEGDITVVVAPALPHLFVGPFPALQAVEEQVPLVLAADNTMEGWLRRLGVARNMHVGARRPLRDQSSEEARTGDEV